MHQTNHCRSFATNESSLFQLREEAGERTGDVPTARLSQDLLQPDVFLPKVPHRRGGQDLLQLLSVGSRVSNMTEGVGETRSPKNTVLTWGFHAGTKLTGTQFLIEFRT